MKVTIMKNNIKIIAFSCAGIFLTFLLLSTNPNTPAGEEGYVYETPWIIGKGGFKGTMTGPQKWGISWWNNKVINMDMRPVTLTEGFQVLAKDDLNMSFSVDIVLDPEDGKISEFIEKYGGLDYYNRNIKKPFRSAVRDAVKDYRSEDFKNNQSQIAESVKVALPNIIGNIPLRVNNVVAGNIQYPPVVTKAVEGKLAREQELQKKDTDLEIAKKEAEIEKVVTQGIADAQAIIDRSLTENYLQYKAIEAQMEMANSNNHTTIYIPVSNNGIPIVKNVD